MFIFATSAVVSDDIMSFLGGLGIVLLTIVGVLALVKVLIGLLRSKTDEPAATMPAPLPAAFPATPAIPSVGAVSASAPGAPPTGVLLDGVDEKTAAVVMAVVADELKTPLEELRFVSIREAVPAHIQAIIMALVADKLKAPLNQLRFVSIREGKGEVKS